jgi:hypothetical protein
MEKGIVEKDSNKDYKGREMKERKKQLKERKGKKEI